jgi:hypothetical protein
MTHVFAAIKISALLGVIAYTIVLRQKYAPLYIPIACVIENKTLGKPMLLEDGSVKTKIITETRCTNNNVYDIHVDASDSDEVFLLTRSGNQTDISRIGSVDVPALSIERHGESTSMSIATTVFSKEQLAKLAAAEEVQMLTNMSSEVYVRLDLLVASMNTPWFTSYSWCGTTVNPNVYPPDQGSTACFSKESELLGHVPSVTSPKANLELASMSSDRIRFYGAIRDVLCCVLVVFGLLAALSVLRSSCCLAVETLSSPKSNSNMTEEQDLEAGISEKQSSKCLRQKTQSTYIESQQSQSTIEFGSTNMENWSDCDGMSQMGSSLELR